MGYVVTRLVENHQIHRNLRVATKINDCCCVKMALKVSKLHKFVTIQDTYIYIHRFKLQWNVF